METLILGDCLEKMKDIENWSVDMILCDLPYGTTNCAWDTVIPFGPLWEQYKRIIKKNGAIVLFGSQPFTTDLIMSNRKWFRYCWIWDKKKPAGFQIAKYRPMMVHEDIAVFSSETPNYYPIKIKRDEIKKSRTMGRSDSAPLAYNDESVREYTDYYPQSILPVSNADQTNKLHPTQKPVELCSYLIRTYTNEGETVMDNCMGSGTTGVACVHTCRNFIGIEIDPTYFEIAKKRVESAQLPLL